VIDGNVRLAEIMNEKPGWIYFPVLWSYIRYCRSSLFGAKGGFR
jgi:hypothetical protein